MVNARVRLGLRKHCTTAVHRGIKVGCISTVDTVLVTALLSCGVVRSAARSLSISLGFSANVSGIAMGLGVPKRSLAVAVVAIPLMNVSSVS